ncbi:MAG TPA: aminotransferase class I/II-fold pyridoxal phosphate-dependent enzyme [Victivallales bacterium]|nr:aminotransferase class I/II-fold pyridoxal phosphate-dependent enzyme [Victivallales bacterium]
MSNPELSLHFESRQPSSIRLAQIEFEKRNDNVEAVNTAIGNISLPMHPAMHKRLINITSENSPFNNGVVKYTSSGGTEEANRAFLNIIESSGFSTKGLFSQITDGGSQAMELTILGVCGPAGSDEKPLLMIDAAYANYLSFGSRLGRKAISVRRTLRDDGTFTLPNLEEMEAKIKKYNPGALVVIPYDNPTGHFYDRETMIILGKLCVKYNMWMVSDEAYREFHYKSCTASSVWALTEKDVPGITGRRISIETASKVWNACGLRIGALVTDNKLFNQQSIAEYTANLCANAIGQYIFGALAYENHDDLEKWYEKQREYYKPMMTELRISLQTKLPGIIVSNPEAALYSVIDVRNIAKPGFNSNDFVLFCSQKGKIDIAGHNYTLLVAPMSGFYSVEEGEVNPGDSQMRVAYVVRPEKMILLPHLFESLFKEYEAGR